MLSIMELFHPFFLALVLASVPVWCQTVQDNWTVQDYWIAPAAPDGSTPLQSGSKFTLRWNSNLKDNFAAHCPSCDTKNLALWIASFNGTKLYTSKIGRQ
jgi:hypothetical protein